MTATGENAFSQFIVGSLPMTEDSIAPDTLGRNVAKLFESSPKLSGLLILDEGRLCGMVSREQFNQRLARKFGIEISYSRPILGLFDGIFDMRHTPLLVVGEEATVKEVAELCLHRNEELIYEPVIVHRPGRGHALVDFHDLLISQTRLLAETYSEALRQKELADEANSAKSQFLANVSHELRTPLTAILGYAEIVLEDMVGEAPGSPTITRLNNICKAGEHLLTIIGSLLDIAKIESGRIELFIEPFDVRALVEEVAETLNPLATSKGNKLELTWENDPGEMISDVTKLRQNLFNLLSNAIKFTKQGSIGITVRRFFQESREMISFRVSDSGIGMTPQQMKKIFEPFTQADTSTTRNYGGTGLGLTVTLNFSHLMGGDIHVESSPGVGTSFTMVLPATLETRADEKI